MTVCIGALCDDSKSLVVASDRMVTLGGMQEFEHEVPKITQVSEKVLALQAGDAHRGYALIHDVKLSLPAGLNEVPVVADIFSQKYLAHREKQLDAEIFKPRGINRQDFYAGKYAQGIPQQLFFQIDQHLATFNFGVDLLIAGVDDHGAHLFQLGNPGGKPIDLASIGYGSIGSGSLHAVQSMVAFCHSVKKSLNDTVFSVYSSKRRAEVAPGVGKDTDMAIITSTGIKWLTQAHLSSLGELFATFIRPTETGISDRVATILST